MTLKMRGQKWKAQASVTRVLRRGVVAFCVCGQFSRIFLVFGGASMQIRADLRKAQSGRAGKHWVCYASRLRVSGRYVPGRCVDQLA